MKLPFLNFFIFILFITSANAQEKSFGVKGGLNLTTLSGGVEDNSMKVSFHAGIYGNLILNKELSIRPEILLSNQGTVFSEENITHRYWLINAPVLLNIKLRNSIYLNLGPQLGMLLSAKSIDRDSDETSNIGGIRNYDISAVLGIGSVFYNDSNIELRIVPGLTNQIDDSLIDEDLYHFVIQLSFSYPIN